MKSNEREVVWMESGRDRCEETRDAWKKKRREEGRERGREGGKAKVKREVGKNT